MKKKLYTLRPESPLSDAYDLMNAGVRAILVTDEKNRLMGILTRRDLNFQSIGDIKTLKVIDCCTKELLITAPVGISNTRAIDTLKKYKIYHLPIVDRSGKAVDLLSYNDLLARPAEAFVMLPFKEPYLTIFEDHIRKVIEGNFSAHVKKVDDLFKPEPIIKTIQSLIDQADFLIAEITERNPNVYYEIGFAHGKDKKIIFITQDVSNLPFDIAHWRCLKYDYTPPGIIKFEKELKQIVKEILDQRDNELVNLE